MSCFCDSDRCEESEKTRDYYCMVCENAGFTLPLCVCHVCLSFWSYILFCFGVHFFFNVHDFFISPTFAFAPPKTSAVRACRLLRHSPARASLARLFRQYWPWVFPPTPLPKSIKALRRRRWVGREGRHSLVVLLSTSLWATYIHTWFCCLPPTLLTTRTPPLTLQAAKQTRGSVEFVPGRRRSTQAGFV